MAAKVKALQAWCKAQCDGYRDVEIRNMTSSWKSGLAFCAMIHRYRPDLIDYDSLSKENVFENNQLAFEVAERELNIPALLDAEDMVAMAVPDKLCVVTYVSQYYNRLGNKEKLGGPGVKGKVATKRPSTDKSSSSSLSKKSMTSSENKSEASSSRGGTLTDSCAMCHQKVYVMERHMDGSKLYHRRCIREQQRSQRSPTRKSPREKKTFSFETNKMGNKEEVMETREKENRKPVSHATPSSRSHLIGSRSNAVSSPVTSSTTTTTANSNKLFSKRNSAPKPYSGIGTDTKSSTTGIGTDKTSSTSTSSSEQLFTKLNGTPKPYVSNAFNTDVKTTTSSPTNRMTSKPSGVSNTSSAINKTEIAKEPTRSESPLQQKSKFTAKFYGNKSENPLLKKSVGRPPRNLPEEPMDTTSSSSDNHSKANSNNSASTANVVTAKTFGGGSQPMTANVTKVSQNDTQVLQGLLKNLAGVRNKTPTTSPETNPLSSPRNKSTDYSTTSKSTDDKPAFTKINLRAPPKDEFPRVSPRSKIEENTTSKSHDNIPKPKQRMSKLLQPEQDKHVNKSHHHEPSSSKTNDKTHVSNYMREAKDTRNGYSAEKSKSHGGISDHPTNTKQTDNKPKSILKNKDEPAPSVKENASSVPLFLQRQTPWSPPLSVFPSSDKNRGSLLESVQLDSSDEFENKGKDSKQDVQATKMSPHAPPRPSQPPAHSPAIKSKVDTKSDTSSQSKTKNRPQPKSSWQIEMEARQGKRQHEPKAGLKSTTRQQKHATDVDNKATESKTEWQIEAEKREEKRRIEGNVISDKGPVAPPRHKPPPRPTSPPHFNGHVLPAGKGRTSHLGLNIKELMDKKQSSTHTVQDTNNAKSTVHEENSTMGNESPPNYIRASVTSDEDPFGRTSQLRTSGGVARKPAFRVDEEPSPEKKKITASPLPNTSPDEKPAWVLEAEKRKQARNGVYLDPETNPETTKRKIIPDTRFTYSYDFESPTDQQPNGRLSPEGSADHWNGMDMRNRPLPDVPSDSPLKRKVNAEDRMAVDEIVEQLEHLDATLQILEHEGRGLEDKIRLSSDDAMDENDLMVQWFELVNQKNELVRKETDLMFRKKAQELEDEHEDIEYELRLLLHKPEHLKTPSEKVKEESLLQELMDTVSLRNSIVDNIEENRKRYIEEDKEIASVMAMRGFCTQTSQNDSDISSDSSNRPAAKKGKKKKKNKEKKEFRAGDTLNETENSQFYCV